MSFRPLLLLVPSKAAATELPRRLASTGRALAGVYAWKPLDLARAIAEPLLLGRGLRPWDGGHDALLAARLLADTGGAGLRLPEGAPIAPVAAALARTLVALRRGRIDPAAVDALAEEAAAPEDRARLAAVARLARGFETALEGRTADPVTLVAAAREGLASARWLDDADVLVVDDLELDPNEAEMVAALAAVRPTRILKRALPPSLRPSAFRAAMAARGLSEADWSETPLAPLAPPAPPRAAPPARELFEAARRPRVEDPISPGSSPRRARRPRCAPSCAASSARRRAECPSRRWASWCPGPRSTRLSSRTFSAASAFPTGSIPRFPCGAAAPRARSSSSSAAAASSGRRSWSSSRSRRYRSRPCWATRRPPRRRPGGTS
ncbi:MAG: hypothetical protein U0599_10700 [Vicinamibacteria bacterium]